MTFLERLVALLEHEQFHDHEGADAVDNAYRRGHNARARSILVLLRSELSRAVHSEAADTEVSLSPLGPSVAGANPVPRTTSTPKRRRVARKSVSVSARLYRRLQARSDVSGQSMARIAESVILAALGEEERSRAAVEQAERSGV